MLRFVHPIIKAAPVVAILAAVSAMTTMRSVRQTEPRVTPPRSAARVGAPVACPSGAFALDSGQPCIVLPPAEDADRGARNRLLSREPASPGLELDKSGEMVARMPDRPSDYPKYQLPIEPAHSVTGPDDPPPSEGPELGIRIAADRGRPVQLVELEEQRGQARVVAVGELYGITVVTAHVVERGDKRREYLVLHGRLERPGPGLVAGGTLGPLAVIGFVSGDPAHLYFEVRELRQSLPDTVTHLSALVSAVQSVAVDPRNVLALKR
jgi:hypothetical protein